MTVLSIIFYLVLGLIAYAIIGMIVSRIIYAIDKERGSCVHWFSENTKSLKNDIDLSIVLWPLVVIVEILWCFIAYPDGKMYRFVKGEASPCDIFKALFTCEEEDKKETFYHVVHFVEDNVPDNEQPLKMDFLIKEVNPCSRASDINQWMSNVINTHKKELSELSWCDKCRRILDLMIKYYCGDEFTIVEVAEDITRKIP